MTNVSSMNASAAYGGGSSSLAPTNYRAISMIENSQQLNNSVMLNTTQLLSNRHASISGGVPGANRKNLPG
jgi:hypothetical protein